MPRICSPVLPAPWSSSCVGDEGNKENSAAATVRAAVAEPNDDGGVALRMSPRCAAPTFATPFLDDYSLAASVVLECGVTGPIRTCTRRADGLAFAFKQLPYCAETVRELAIWQACLPHPHILDIVAVYDNVLAPTHTLAPATVSIAVSSLFISTSPSPSPSPVCNGEEPDSEVEGRFFFVVMPRMATDLFALASEQSTADGPFSDDQLRLLLAQLTAGIAHIHACGYVHGDIKLENVLLESRSLAPSQQCLKICDFGFARAAHELPRRRQYTRAYISPEAITSYDHFTATKVFRPIGPSADVWALGVAAYTLVHLALPFAPRPNEHGARDNRTLTPSLRYQIQNGMAPYRLRRGSLLALSFVDTCLQPCLSMRPSAARLVAHPFLH